MPLPQLPQLPRLFPMILQRFQCMLCGGAIASLLLLSPCAAAAAGANAIVVAQAIDLSGPDGAIGRDYVAGITTCFDMINAGGGINGRHIDYVVRDDQGKPEQAARLVADLIAHEQPDYLLGGVGDDAVSAVTQAPAFRRSGMALFAPLAGGGYPDSSHVLFWRPTYRQEIRYLLDYFSKLGLRKAGIVYQEKRADSSEFQDLRTEIEARHLQLTATARIGAGAVERQALQVSDAHPDFVLVLADSIGSALFLKAFRKHDAHTFVAGTSLTNLTTLRELAGSAAVEWTVFSQVVPNPNAGTSLLQIQHLDMMHKFRDEAISSLTLEGFAAAKTLVRAMEARRRGYAALHDFFAQGTDIDLGGLAVAVTDGGNRLSSYVDVALFQKGDALLF